MVFRIEKTRNYTVMSNYHLRDKNLSLKAKGLLSWMLSNNDDWDYSLEGIVACCKEGETAVASALKELQEYGYVVIVKNKPDTECNRIHYDYLVYEQPQKSESQGVGFLGLEVQGVENQGQRNTNQRNTKKENNTISKDIVSETEPNKSQPIKNNSEAKGKNLYQKCLDLINEFSQDEDIRNLLDTYLRMRLSMKDKPIYGVNQWRGLLNKLSLLGGDIKENIQYSTERGYASFYAPQKYQTTRKINKSVFGENDDNRSDKVTKEEIENGYFTGETL